MTDLLKQKAIKRYIQNDAYAKHLGATVEIVKPGHCRVYLTITEDMTNFHGTTHGGIIFSIGDIAFGAASNSHGQIAVALDVNICFLKASKPGDRLIAEAKEQHLGGKTALYEISVKDEKSGALIAKSQNLVYRKREKFIAADEMKKRQ